VQGELDDRLTGRLPVVQLAVTWIHGQLWLLPEGLLRVRTDLDTTIGHANRRTVVDELLLYEFAPGEIALLARQDKRNLWLRADEIVAASFREGLLNSRLSLTLDSGRRIKLLWLRADPAIAPLKQALASWGIAV
jgi:hypothetical protein